MSQQAKDTVNRTIEHVQEVIAELDRRDGDFARAEYRAIYAYGSLYGIEAQLKMALSNFEPNPFEGCDETPALDQAA
jgi:hypothetical protein